MMKKLNLVLSVSINGSREELVDQNFRNILPGPDSISTPITSCCPPHIQVLLRATKGSWKKSTIVPVAQNKSLKRAGEIRLILIRNVMQPHTSADELLS